jgi:hypothetical protein
MYDKSCDHSEGFTNWLKLRFFRHTLAFLFAILAQFLGLFAAFALAG